MGILALLAGDIVQDNFYICRTEAIATINIFFGFNPFIAAYVVFNNMPKKSVLYTCIVIPNSGFLLFYAANRE
jgi:hypothetical protein